MEDFESISQQCETNLRVGKLPEARRTLEGFKSHTVPRRLAANVANLFRRTGLVDRSLALLKPHIYPTLKQEPSPSDYERVEYAMALQLKGAFQEAKSLLALVDPMKEIRAEVASAYQHIFHWNYANAIDALHRALTSSELSAYEKQICRVNLLSCYAYENRSPDFADLFSELSKELREQGRQLLLGNVYEIQAQHCIDNESWNDANSALNLAEECLRDEKDFSFFYVRKWRGIGQGLQNKAVAPLLQVRNEALALQDWETLRHVDFYLTLVDPAGPHADWVFYGTPYESFRRKIRSYKEFTDEKWISRDPEVNPEARLRLDPWFVDEGDTEILHRTMVYLLTDFYRPFKVGEIAAHLFDLTHFDLHASSNRVHKLTQRLREWLAKNKIPYRMEEVEGTYALRPLPGLAILARRDAISVDRTAFLFQRQRSRAKDPLAASDWAKILSVSPSAARSLLATAANDGIIQPNGSGRYTTYQLLKKGTEKS